LDGNHPHKKIIKETKERKKLEKKKKKKNLLLDVAFDSSSKVVCFSSKARGLFIGIREALDDLEILEQLQIGLLVQIE
jgi:hypothetical protein